MDPPHKNLLGLNREELSTFAESIGEKRYRGQQIFGWLYERGAREFPAMTNLGKAFLERLERTAAIRGLTLRDRQTSRRDGTTKFLFELQDGLLIESVLIPPRSAFQPDGAGREDEYRRLSLCVSTQVGCPLDCKFCATGTMGFRRNLTAAEIVDQVLQVRNLTGRRVTNVVFMGMGEPMLNYDQMMGSADLMIEGAGIAARHMTVSTAGWSEGIRRMADEGRKMKLAVSLHSAVESTRTALMPVTKRFGLRDLLAALEYYCSRTEMRVTFEIIFFEGINDSEKELSALIDFVRRVPSKVNVIPFHSIAFAGGGKAAVELRPAPALERLVAALRSANLSAFVRTNAGDDIEAACGQLAVQHPRRGPGERSLPNPSILVPARHA